MTGSATAKKRRKVASILMEYQKTVVEEMMEASDLARCARLFVGSIHCLTSNGRVCVALDSDLRRPRDTGCMRVCICFQRWCWWYSAFGKIDSD